MSGIKGLFGDTAVDQTHQNFTGHQQRHASPKDRMLSDLFRNMMTGQMMDPQELDIPAPLRQAIQGTSNANTSMMAGAFGPNRGLAGSLAAGAAGAGDYPAIGDGPTRSELGLSDIQAAPPGFLPDQAKVAGNVPQPRVSPEIASQNRLEDQITRRQKKGKPTAGLERQLERTRSRPGLAAGGR